MNERMLWNSRIQFFLKEISRYSKYMFNNHLVIILIIGAGGLGLYYQKWLAELSPQFPVAFVISIIMMVVLTSGSIITMLKEADIIYLLPMESRLKKYFLNAFIFSYSIQAVITVAIFMITAPLYSERYGLTGMKLLILITILLLAKLWNMAVVWETTYSLNHSSRLQDKWIRYVVNFLFLFSLISEIYIMIILVMIVMISILYIKYNATKNKVLNWHYLIEKEQSRWALFYRIANMFVDVPHMRVQIKRRKWMDFLLSNIPYGKKHTYGYLYLRTFLRSGDYLGLFIRLVIIGSGLIILMPNAYVAVTVSTAFLYFIAFQLVTLFDHHSNMIWLKLYPINNIQKEQSFRKLFSIILMIGAGIFTIVVGLVTLNILATVVTLLLGVTLSYFYGKMKKLKSH